MRDAMSLPAVALAKGESHTLRAELAVVNNGMDVHRYLRESMAT